MKAQFLVVLFLAFAVTACLAVPAEWTTPVAPFKISGNLYYVGSRDLAAYLIVTTQGNILINSNLESSPPQIRHSVEQLGFQWKDTKILLTGQAHYDHVAGAAEILRETQAQYLVMEGDVDVMQTGGASDYDSSLSHFPPAHVERTLHDNEAVTLGGTTLVAHKTAGHTRGCTTWTLQTHEGGRTFNVVIVGGWALNPGLSLVASHGKRAAYPGIADDFERTFATLKALPCDIFLGAHGVYFDMISKLERVSKEGSSVWIDREGYRKAVLEHESSYRKELARQKGVSDQVR
jgi:metallo-beta-lactamase class B